MTTPPIPPASPEEPSRASVPPVEAATPAHAPVEPIQPVHAPVEPIAPEAASGPAVLPSESIAALPSYPTGPGYSVGHTGPPPPAPSVPHNPWAGPSDPTRYQSSPYSAPPVPPQRTSNAPLIVGLVVGSLLLLTLASVFYAVVSRNVYIATPTRTTDPMTYAVPTTNPTPLPPPAQIGDCVKLSGPSFNLDYEKLACDAGMHNYTVSKVLSTRSEKCGEDPDAYVKYEGWDGRKSSHLCMIPVFVDGQCYNFDTASLNAEFLTSECSFLVVRAKVLPNTVDKAACGPNPALALAYPEIKTTYCFTQAE
ncbi:hypothetical protein JNUCC0626_49240 [Lentzea sp. JNUCC 0626]|uniref:LppU/SCO3897 family protein n=1 Tax=Lentzea sp. JNUCC 0626 TaxID=3367513 RepID=UPI00374842AC